MFDAYERSQRRSEFVAGCILHRLKAAARTMELDEVFLSLHCTPKIRFQEFRHALVDLERSGKISMSGQYASLRP